SERLRVILQHGSRGQETDCHTLTGASSKSLDILARTTPPLEFGLVRRLVFSRRLLQRFERPELVLCEIERHTFAFPEVWRELELAATRPLRSWSFSP